MSHETASGPIMKQYGWWFGDHSGRRLVSQIELASDAGTGGDENGYVAQCRLNSAMNVATEDRFDLAMLFQQVFQGLAALDRKSVV